MLTPVPDAPDPARPIATATYRWLDSPPRHQTPATRTSAYSSEGFTSNVLTESANSPWPGRANLDRMSAALEAAKRIRQQYESDY